MTATGVMARATTRPITPESAAGIRRIGVVVLALSTIVFVWFASTGRGTLLAADPFGGFFDLQARAMFHGRLNVPAGSLEFEGFVVDGRTYTYFGLFPSILRMPVLLVTDQLDGKLTPLSMTVAHIVGMWSSVLIVERVHRLLRPGDGWTRPGRVLAGAVLVAIGLGSNLLYAASRAWVYHEAGLWGAVGVLAAFAAILDSELRPRARPIVAAGCWTAVAWLSRGSVGVAPTLVLLLLGVAHLTDIRWLQSLAPRPRSTVAGVGSAPSESEVDVIPVDGDDGTTARLPPSPPWPRRPRLAAGMIVAGLAGGLVFGAVNAAKFGSPTALPFDKQVASRLPWPDRTEALEEYGGDLMSPALFPVNVVQALRPDLLRPSRAWPGVRYEDVEPIGLFDPVFDTVEPTAGLTLTVPGLLVLTTVAVVAAGRRRRPTAPGDQPDDAAVLRPYLVGGALASVASLSIAFASQRYLSDLMPLLVVGGAGGLAVVDRWAGSASPARRSGHERDRRQRRVRGAVTAIVAVTAIGVVANVAVTWLFQRVEAPKDVATRLSGLQARITAHDVLGFRIPPLVRAAEAPDVAEDQKILVVGRCKAMYWGSHDTWIPLEVTRRAGHHRLRLRLVGELATRPVPILTLGEGDRRFVLAVQAIPGRPGKARLLAVQRGEVTTLGRAFDVTDLHGVDLDVWVDPVVGGVQVSFGDRWTGAERSVLFRVADVPELTPWTVGRNPHTGPVAKAFPGVVREQVIDVSTCREVLRKTSD